LPGARFFRADVTSEAELRPAIAAANEGGRLRGLIHCAGIEHAERVVGKNGACSLEAFEKVIRVNLVGTFNAIRLAAEAIAKNDPISDGVPRPDGSTPPDGERGVLIATASVAAFDGQIGQAAYAASKGAVAAMTLPIARDLARSGIRMVSIAPGVFDTPLLARLGDPVRAALEALVPFPSRLGHPSEFANLAAAIIGNRMLNGEVIRLDGALRMPPK
jgi:NAD(P)-dependent dehydrogenase (short-subunit alcohol dehydrogenase family)